MANTNLSKASNSVLTSAEVNRLLSDDGNGKIGIGTETPNGNVMLDVVGIAKASGGIHLQHRRRKRRG